MTRKKVFIKQEFIDRLNNKRNFKRRKFDKLKPKEEPVEEEEALVDKQAAELDELKSTLANLRLKMERLQNESK